MDSGVIALPRTNSHPDPGGGRGFYKLPAPFSCGLLERPIPRRAPTHGGDSPSIQFQGRDPLSAVSVNTLPKSRSCSTCTASGAIATDCPPPRRGGGRRPRSGRAVGVARREPFNQRRRRQVRRGTVSASPSAPPPGGDCPSIQCHGRGDLLNHLPDEKLPANSTPVPGYGRRDRLPPHLPARGKGALAVVGRKRCLTRWWCEGIKP